MGAWQKISSNVNSKAVDNMMSDFLEHATGVPVKKSFNPLAVAGAVAGGAVIGGALGPSMTEANDVVDGAFMGGALGGAGVVAYNIIKNKL